LAKHSFPHFISYLLFHDIISVIASVREIPQVKHYNLYFGQAYGEGNYGEGSYSCTEQQQADGECTVAAGGGTSSGGSCGLADTGMLDYIREFDCAYLAPQTSIATRLG
jgi:hypothetical protein